MDGVPAPISRISFTEDAVAAKKIVSEVLHHDLLGEAGSASVFWTEDMTWYGPVGFGTATNKQEYEEVFLAAIRDAFSDRHLQVKDNVVVVGQEMGRNNVDLGANFRIPKPPCYCRWTS